MLQPQIVFSLQFDWRLENFPLPSPPPRKQSMLMKPAPEVSVEVSPLVSVGLGTRLITIRLRGRPEPEDKGDYCKPDYHAFTCYMLILQPDWSLLTLGLH